MKKKHTFTQFARREAVSAGCALLARYEERDRLEYIEGPKIENQYMQRIGNYERTVVLEELEVEILLKAKEFIQAAINRREAIDEEALQKLMDDHRARVTGSSIASNGNKQKLTDEEKDELQEIYSDIVQNFHPGTHHDLTDVEKALFEKAVQAYKDQNLDMLKLIYKMLYSDLGGIKITVSLEATILDVSDQPMDTTDYTLAEEIFDCFAPTTEEINLLQEKELYKQQLETVIEEIQKIRNTFPFNTQELLNNPAQLDEYRKKLDFRMELAKSRRKELEQDIEEMKERARDYE